MVEVEWGECEVWCSVLTLLDWRSLQGTSYSLQRWTADLQAKSQWACVIQGEVQLRHEAESRVTALFRGQIG